MPEGISACVCGIAKSRERSEFGQRFELIAIRCDPPDEIAQIFESFSTAFLHEPLGGSGPESAHRIQAELWAGAAEDWCCLMLDDEAQRGRAAECTGLFGAE